MLKRLLIQVSAFNLGMLMRQSLGVGTPRGLQGRICALMLLILSLFKRLKGLFGLIPAAWPEKTQLSDPFAASTGGYHLSSENVLPPRAAREVLSSSLCNSLYFSPDIPHINFGSVFLRPPCNE